MSENNMGKILSFEISVVIHYCISSVHDWIVCILLSRCDLLMKIVKILSMNVCNWSSTFISMGYDNHYDNKSQGCPSFPC